MDFEPRPSGARTSLLLIVVQSLKDLAPYVLSLVTIAVMVIVVIAIYV